MILIEKISRNPILDIESIVSVILIGKFISGIECVLSLENA